MRLCSIPGCGAKHDAKGYCHAHYNKWKRHGDPLTPDKISRDGSGWIARGYRYFTVDGRKKREHVIVAERALGKPLPPGAIVHHVDEDRLNNRGDNLVICPSHYYHHLIHQRMRALDACGNANYKKCPYCKRYDDPANMRAEKSGRHVHRACSADAQRIARNNRERKHYDIHV